MASKGRRHSDGTTFSVRQATMGMLVEVAGSAVLVLLSMAVVTLVKMVL